MAEVDSSKLPSLSEQYLLKQKEPEPEMAAKSVEADAKPPTPEEVTQETPVVADTEVAEEGSEAAPDNEATPDNEAAPDNEATNDVNTAPSEATDDSVETENSDNQEAEETPEIKLETAPADFRFPTTNQSRHCFTRYIEYHRCVAAKGEGAPECDKFAKYYRSLCPGEWVDRWNEQRENGTFPGPL